MVSLEEELLETDDEELLEEAGALEEEPGVEEAGVLEETMVFEEAGALEEATVFEEAGTALEAGVDESLFLEPAVVPAQEPRAKKAPAAKIERSVFFISKINPPMLPL